MCDGVLNAGAPAPLDAPAADPLAAVERAQAPADTTCCGDVRRACVRDCSTRWPGESLVDQAVRVATHLDRTTLAVQGPPGAGKTYVGAQMIRALVTAGKKVGVVAVSHKVIRNLLDAVRAQAIEAGENVRLGAQGRRGRRARARR